MVNIDTTHRPACDKGSLVNTSLRFKGSRRNYSMLLHGTNATNMNLWIHATMWIFPRLRGLNPLDHSEKNLGGESEEVMVSPLSTTIIKAHLQCPPTSIQTVFTQGSSKVSMCAAERSSKKGCVLKTSMKYKLKNIKAACGLMRNRPEELNCLDPFSPQFKKHNDRTGNWQCNSIFWSIFWTICHFLTACSVPMNCTTHNTKKHRIELTRMNFAWPSWERKGKKAAWNVFILECVIQLKRKYFPFHPERKEKSWFHWVNNTQNWILI